MQLTEKLRLKKPEYEDGADIGVISEDMDLIDSALSGHTENDDIHVTGEDKLKYNSWLDAGCTYASKVYTLTLVKPPAALADVFTVRFKTPNAYVGGSAFRIGGVSYTPTLTNSDDAMPEGQFIAGKIVTAQVDRVGKKINFKAGGDGFKPRISVQLSEPASPAPKTGDIWVVDEGYTLDKLVVFVGDRPASPVNAVYLNASNYVNVYHWIAQKHFDLSSYLSYGQAYFNGWKDACVLVYIDNRWVNFCIKSGLVFSGGYIPLYNDLGPQEPPYTVYNHIAEHSPINGEVLRAHSYDAIVGGGSVQEDIGGTFQRLFKRHRNKFTAQVDLDTFAILHSIGDIQGPETLTGHSAIGGTATHLYAADTGGGVLAGNKYIRLDQDTFATMETVQTAANVKGIGGMKERLFVCNRQTAPMYCEIDATTGTILLSNNNGSAESIDGTASHLYSALFLGDGFIYELDPATLSIIKTLAYPKFDKRVGSGVGCTK